MASPELDPEAVRRGATIRALRQANGLKIYELASAAGVSRSYLSNVEAGRKKAPPKLCLDIAGYLGVPLAAITAPGYAPAAPVSA
jgi:transcriptional regulator with XRE-family HTH domain